MYSKMVLIFMIVLVSIPYTTEIFGGSEALIEDFPHHVAIEHNGSYLCAGAIISNTQVVTVAHCVFNLRINLTVRAGTSTLKTGGSLHKVSKIDVHKGYVLNHTSGRLAKILNMVARYAYDIALVHVAESFGFSQKCRPIKLFDQSEETKPGSAANVTGWGRTSNENLMSDKLQYVDVRIIDRRLCESAYSEDGGLGRGKICAGHYRPRGLTKDACTGDSGGGLVVDGRLAGLVSYGKLCGLPDYPGVYTDVAYFSDWIKECAAR